LKKFVVIYYDVLSRKITVKSAGIETGCLPNMNTQYHCYTDVLCHLVGGNEENH